jgi:endonuclease-3
MGNAKPPATKRPPAPDARRPPPRTHGAAGAGVYSPAEIEAIFTRLSDADPEPKSELEYTDPFTLLVAVVLSAQATDAGVNKATRRLFALADTPETMVDLGEERVAELIRTIGLYRNKAKNVVALARQLIERHGGAVPHDRAALEALPGVGRKTASVVLNVAFGEPTIAVDTHIFRLGNRLGLAPGRTPEEVERGLLAIVPERFLQHAHHWLILHGRYTCVARGPKCGNCRIADLCKSPEKRLPAAA